MWENKDGARKRLMKYIAEESLFSSAPYSPAKNGESFFDRFYADGKVVRHITEQLEGLDFIQLAYVLKYFERRLEVAQNHIARIDAEYPGNLYQIDVGKKGSKLRQDQDLYSSCNTEIIYYNAHIPKVRMKLIEVVCTTFNIRV